MNNSTPNKIDRIEQKYGKDYGGELKPTGSKNLDELLMVDSTPKEKWHNRHKEYFMNLVDGFSRENGMLALLEAERYSKKFIESEIATAKQEQRQECIEKIKEALEVEKCCYTMHCGCLMENSGLRKNFDDLIKKLEEEK